MGKMELTGLAAELRPNRTEILGGSEEYVRRSDGIVVLDQYDVLAALSTKTLRIHVQCPFKNINEYLTPDEFNHIYGGLYKRTQGVCDPSLGLENGQPFPISRQKESLTTESLRSKTK